MTLSRLIIVAGGLLAPLCWANPPTNPEQESPQPSHAVPEAVAAPANPPVKPEGPSPDEHIVQAGEQSSAADNNGVNTLLLQGLNKEPLAEHGAAHIAEHNDHQQPVPVAKPTVTEVQLTPTAPTANPPAPHSEPTHTSAPTAKQEEIASLIRVALQKTAAGDFESASIAYRQLLDLPLTQNQQRTVLLDYARMLRKKGDLTKATAIYEKVLKEYPLAEDTPDIYLDLGRIQRALGAYKTAISRFYNVINSTLKLPEDGAMRYRQLAKTAQFEIAETLFQAGDYEEASRFYSRLKLLDLATVDRARAHFKSAYALFLANDFTKAAPTLLAYMEQYPDDENVPEARYLLAISYRRIQRPQEALNEALNLLRTEKARTEKDPRRWAYWQRKTGNQIANEFYDQGDYASALTIYSTLAELAPEITWKLPILYQMGICQERLGHIPLAIANYQTIIDSMRAPQGDAANRTELSDLERMATWRMQQISWQENSETRLHLLIPAALPSTSTPAETPAPSP